MGKKLHVGNLPSSATEEDLSVKFGRFGTVESVTVERDAHTGRSKGFASIEMANDVQAEAAITWLHLSQYDGLTMGVSEARAEKERS